MLLLGPLYHLVSQDDRQQAWEEAVRVARRGSVVVGVGISRYASLLDGLKRGLLSDEVFRRIVEADLADGQHRNPDVDNRPEFFTTSYFHLPGELTDEAHAAGLEGIELLAIEGPAWMMENIDDIDSQLFAARSTESEAALMAASSHMMVVGRTPGRTMIGSS